ncbi:MAG TPA: glycoside hydrolase family 15 protein [Armatimonadota bacterium]|nr:glycoside hydrolase family 15 protein [Armatimonadota bacterium]
MPVYQPNSVVGNSRVLITLGLRGELMTFFYPHIDFSQNLQEGMPAVYFPGEGGRPGHLVWTFDASWQATQKYLERTNIVETQLLHVPTGLTLHITDMVHPSEPVLLRRFLAGNPTSKPLRTKLFQYLDVQLGEVEQRNAFHYHVDRNIGVAYWRNICFAIGGSAFDEYGCGRAGPQSHNSTKAQLERGSLDRQLEEIGNVDLGVGWQLSLSPGERTSRDLIIAANSSEIAAVARVDGFQNLGWEAALRWTRNRSKEHVESARPVRIEPDLTEAYYRSLLAIDLLADPDTGSILAAPEFDPFFERSGGYGYCWPRDAVEVCLAMEAAGYPAHLARFLSWALLAQRPEGYWEQRYWLSGQRGPAWCTAEDSLQIDQTASVLFAMGRHARTLDERERLAFLEEIWDSAHRAADYLVRSISPERGLHSTAFDLWETFRGTFTYSNGAIAAALAEAAYLARNSGQNGLADTYQATSAAVKNAIMSQLWQGDAFARGFDLDGSLDRAADASALGLITPFEVLRLDDPGEREIALKCVEGVAERLARDLDGAEALLRFEGDGYAGGGPGALTTLWFARALLRLALAPGIDPQKAASCRARAVASLRAVLRAGTSTGLLPEMMGSSPGSHWAAPHAWTMAAFVMACLLLDRLPIGRPET